MGFGKAWLLVASEIKQGARAASGSPAKLLAGVVTVAFVLGTEGWAASLLSAKLALLPPLAKPLASVVVRGASAALVELAALLALVSAVSVALGALQSMGSDPVMLGAPLGKLDPLPLAFLKTARSSLWILLVALPPILAWSGLGSGVVSVVGLAAVLLAASSLGLAVSVALASLVPSRGLLPACWALSGAVIAGAVVQLRSMHLERIQWSDPLVAVMALVAAVGRKADSPLGSLVTGGRVWAALALLFASWLVLGFVWWLGGARALEAGAVPTFRERWGRVASIGRLRGPVWSFLLSRLKLLVRDSVKLAQLFYVAALVVVYIENLRSVPLRDPLASRMAGSLNMFMALLVALALAMRFAYPQRLLDAGSSWWWESSPVGAVGRLAVLWVAASFPVSLLAVGTSQMASVVLGRGLDVGSGALVLWFSLWSSLVGCLVGPGESEYGGGGGRHWLEASLSGGGLLYGASLAVVGVLVWVLWSWDLVVDVAMNFGVVVSRPWVGPWSTAFLLSVLAFGGILLWVRRER